MNIALDVLNTAQQASAITFYGGYAVGSNGSLTQFPPASVLAEHRNEKGRVTYGLFQFPDLSKIEMKYTENRGTLFKVVQ